MRWAQGFSRQLHCFLLGTGSRRRGGELPQLIYRVRSNHLSALPPKQEDRVAPCIFGPLQAHGHLTSQKSLPVAQLSPRIPRLASPGLKGCVVCLCPCLSFQYFVLLFATAIKNIQKCLSRHAGMLHWTPVQPVVQRTCSEVYPGAIFKKVTGTVR